jgi:phage-related protein
MLWAKIALAGGVGALGFGMFRMILGGAYDQHRVWYLVWEEGMEFLFILGILGVLMIFRRGLAIAWPYVSHASSSFRETSYSPQATRSSP